ncbi:GlxA family transcriptional regulator [Halomonas elongata]|uniref:GlxA family transcriptional regulator n=1 Tax=Halomonas elongata TaxID=2746 RepID=UPI0038D39A7E
MAKSARFDSPLISKNRAFIEVETGEAPIVDSRRIAFVLFEHFSLMAFTGAMDALVTANLVKAPVEYEVTVVSIDGRRAMSDLGIEVAVDDSLEDLQEETLDYLILCGGYRLEMHATPELRAKLRAADYAGCMLGGLWNGAYFIAEAGLLDGYECAFHPDGRAMMLSIISRDCDIACISAIEEVLSCDKAAEAIDTSVISIDRDLSLPQSLRNALELMHHNIDEPLSIGELATCVDVSRRQLERLFGRCLETTPARYYLELRLTRARQLLQQTNKDLADIAVAAGFVSISHFRRCFSQLFGVSPGRFRKASRQAR